MPLMPLMATMAALRDRELQMPNGTQMTMPINSATATNIKWSMVA